MAKKKLRRSDKHDDWVRQVVQVLRAFDTSCRRAPSQRARDLVTRLPLCIACKAGKSPAILDTVEIACGDAEKHEIPVALLQFEDRAEIAAMLLTDWLRLAGPFLREALCRKAKRTRSIARTASVASTSG